MILWAFQVVLVVKNLPLVRSLGWEDPLKEGIYTPFAFADFNLFSFAVTNHNHEYYSFSEFCEFFRETSVPGDL